jgi:hypothetical protein
MDNDSETRSLPTSAQGQAARDALRQALAGLRPRNTEAKAPPGGAGRLMTEDSSGQE